jgi:mannan endo-1,4-beta-mannosidase
MVDNDVPRRRVLAVAATGIGSIAGCLTGSTPDGDTSQTDSPTTEPATRTEPPTQTETETPEPTTQVQSFVDVDGTELTIAGDSVHFFGTRPQNVMDLSHPAEWIEDNLDLMQREGYTLARVHAFQPFWGDESKQPQPGEYNEEVMQRLDRVVRAARVRGIRLSLMLLNGKPPYHNADDLADNPGVNAHTYANYAEGADTYDDFYTNAACKELYKQRVEAVLTRENTITGVEYRDEPAIAMWELGNEIEYAEPWTHDDPTLRPWIEEMSRHVKSIDENHLVTTGEFGWAGRNNYTADHAPDGVDLCSIHYYPGPQSYDLENDAERDHPGLLRDLIRTGQRELGKPVYVGEYNWQVETGAEPPLTERNEELRVIHDVLDDVDVAAAAYHSLAQSTQQDWPRGGATTFGDTDDGSMAEFERFAEIQYNKSADGALPAVDAFD